MSKLHTAETKESFQKRINAIPKDSLDRVSNDLAIYGVCLYDNNGKIKYDNFRKQCLNTVELLLENDVPNEKTDIRYQLCGFLSLVKTITGTRNFIRFMSKN